MKTRKASLRLTLFTIIIIIAIIYAVFIRPNYYSFNGGEIFFQTIYNESFISEIFYDVYVYDQSIYISSKNGLKKMSQDGESLWDKSFYIENPSLLTNGMYMSVIDIAGKQAHLFDTNGLVYSMKTNYPILMADLNEEGALVLVQEKDSSHVIQIYNRLGTLVAERGTSFVDDGYPIDIDLSSSSELMITSYVKFDKGIIQSDVSVFSFGEEGENDPENILGGFVAENTIISKVHFIDEKHYVVFSNHDIYFYYLDNKPQLEKQITLSNEIQNIGFCDNAIIVAYGKPLTVTNDSLENQTIVYDSEGKKIKSYKSEKLVERIVGDGNKFYLVTSDTLELYNPQKHIWTSSFQKDIEDIFELNKSTYLIVYHQGYEIVKIKDI